MRIGSLELTSGQPAIMGILNITPDSFADGGELYSDRPSERLEKALHRAEQMQTEGADLLDIGGESTRPGSESIGVAEEADRVLPIVEGLKARMDLPLSVDTSKAEIIAQAAALGADMINDVSALTGPGTLQAAASAGLPVCLMHMQNRPRDMQAQPRYREVVGDVCAWLGERQAKVSAAGVGPTLLDPGFGFGKTLEHNLALLSNLSALHSLGRPLLVGMSRKSMLGTLTGQQQPSQRVYGGIAALLRAVSQGAAVVRVHDVAATRDALRVWQASA